MNSSTAERLLRLNRSFYDGFAGEFSESRWSLQPGIRRALVALGPYKSLLDLGCGNGRVLEASLIPSTRGRHLGVDYSTELLSLAAPSGDPRASFVSGDLGTANWSREVDGRFDAVICFSVLHHIPGPRRRLRLLRETYSLMRPGARCALSVWRFRHVPRLLKKTVAWEAVGLSSDDVDPGDYLLDWRRGGRGLRYVHQFQEEELTQLCRSSGFTVTHTYCSDGETGDMGLYIICEV